MVESQASVPVENRMARRTDKNAGADEQASEFVVEKILAKRFNPRKKQYEYLLKWEGYAQWVDIWLIPLSHKSMDTAKTFQYHPKVLNIFLK